MRKLLIVMLVVAPAAFAQQQKNEFSIFISNPGYGSVHNKSSWEGGGGISFERMFSPHVSAQLSVAEERYYGMFANGQRYPDTVLPVDLIARYHFTTSNRWRPYIGLGARWVHPSFGGEADRLSGEINGGVAFQLRPSIGIFVDGKQALRNETGPHFDPLTKLALGLSWRW